MVDTVYHNTNELQPSSSMMSHNEFWEVYDAIVEEERKEFYKGGYPMVFDPGTGRCWVPRRDYERNRRDSTWRCKEAEWICKQLDEEGVDAYHYEENSKEWEAAKRRYRRNNVRYRSIPRVQDIVVMSTISTIKLPEEGTPRIERVMGWLEEMPDEKRIGGNNDFGGKYQGMVPKNERNLITVKAHIYRVGRVAREDGVLLWESDDMIALKEDKAKEWVEKRFKERMSV